MATNVFTMRIEDDLMDMIRKMAEENHRSVSGQIIFLIECGLKWEKRQEELTGIGFESVLKNALDSLDRHSKIG